MKENYFNKFYLIIIFIIVIALISCNPTKRAQKKIRKIQKNFPALFETQTDTIITTSIRNDTINDIDTFVIVGIKTDTLVRIETDTVTIENERVKTVIQVYNDTLFKVTTIVKPDTIIQEERIFITDTITTTEIKTVEKILAAKPNFFQKFWWLWIVILVMLIASMKRKN